MHSQHRRTLTHTLTPTNHEVIAFAEHYAHTGIDSSFDWSAFKDAVNSYQGDDLTVDTSTSNTVTCSGMPVGQACDRLIGFLIQNISVSTNPVELRTPIASTFANLDSAKKSGWVNFMKSGRQSAWDCRFVIAMPNPDSTNRFYSLVATIRLVSNIADESSWRELSMRYDFTAKVDAMLLVVRKDFKRPS